MHLIITHQNADFDAVASMLAVHKLNPLAIPILPVQHNRNVAEFVTLYRSALPFVHQRDLDKHTTITRLTITDTMQGATLRGVSETVQTTIIDHHEQKRPLASNETWDGEILGAVTTLLVERIQAQHISISSLEATLLMLGIYEDTGMLTYRNTTARDIRAAAWLLEKGAVLDRVRRFLRHPLDEEQKHLYEILLGNADTFDVKGYPVTISTAENAHYVEGINAVAHRLREILDSTALFVLVEVPEAIHLVCRSNHDAVDVGKIARLFGGGGHMRAAAATVRDQPLEEMLDTIRQHLYEDTQPAVSVADLMSNGVQTVQADIPVDEVIHSIRRIGHEGFPVLDGDVVVGLLTRRDADRASEHNLLKMTVREIMDSGNVTLQPDDSVFKLEQTMVETGWGQIPVVDNSGRLIGIVTRTDLIKHWASIHPTVPTTQPLLTPSTMEDILGAASAQLIQTVSEFAQEQQATLYMVGGVVRDLLLNRPNYDIDFVVENNAIQFTEALVKRYGGSIHSYKPFRTAKWVCDESAAQKLNIALEDLPHHIDFATARYEFYERPTALPTVYSGSIKLDLHRRDFTINTLAVQLSPVNFMGRILDNYGGLSDLDQRLIRVLHSLSFVDDPTRILRAVRFSERLEFVIEPRTTELIASALPMLRQITGERLQNELNLLLKEKMPERGLLKLQALGVLPAITPAFTITPVIRQLFDAARNQRPDWNVDMLDQTDLLWHLIMSQLDQVAILEVGNRLLFAQNITRQFQQTAQLLINYKQFINGELSRSQMVRYLDELESISLVTVWIASDNTQFRDVLDQYVIEWKYIKPIANGHTLKAMGLPAGPRYREILDELRDAWLDSIVQTEIEEQHLLERLVGGDIT